MRVRALTLSIALIAPTAAAFAGTSALSLGLRSGYGIPLGEKTQRSDLSDFIRGMIPVWLDAGYRFNSLYIGGFFQYGVGIASSFCRSEWSCSLSDLRVGLEAHYHLPLSKRLEPWVGVGLGYEVLSQRFSGSVLGQPIPSSSSSSMGFEILNLQLGGDFRLGSSLSVGPFGTMTISRYLRETVGGLSAPIQSKSTHLWLIFGARGVFEISL